MVNFQQLWSSQVKKPAFLSEAGSGEKAASKMQLIEGSGQDVEADLLPAMVAENRSRRRSKFCCFSWIADVFAVLALVLIVLATGFLLYKLISLKTELDRMGPTVDQMTMEIDQLKNQAANLQAENAALRSGNPEMTIDDDHPLEFIHQVVLRQMKDDAEEQQAEVDMVQMAMVIFATPNGKNITSEEVPDFMKTTFAGSFPLEASDPSLKLDSTTSQEDKDDDDDSDDDTTDDTNGMDDPDDDLEGTGIKRFAVSKDLDASDNASSTDHE